MCFIGLNYGPGGGGSLSVASITLIIESRNPLRDIGLKRAEMKCMRHSKVQFVTP